MSNFRSDIIRDVKTRLYRAEIFELPEDNRVLVGPTRKTGWLARRAASDRLRGMLLAVLGQEAT